MKNKPIVGAWGSIAPATGQLFIMSLEYLPDCIRFYTEHKSSDSVISTAERGKRVIQGSAWEFQVHLLAERFTDEVRC